MIWTRLLSHLRAMVSTQYFEIRLNKSYPYFLLSAYSTVEDVIMHVARESSLINSNNCMLKVRGLSEYLLPSTRLSSYMYIHQCIKLDVKVELCLRSVSQVPRNLARTVSNRWGTLATLLQ